MATANFPNVNTSKIYAFGFNRYFDADTIEANDYPAEWLDQYDEMATRDDYEWYRDDAIQQLNDKGWRDNCNGDAIAKKSVCVSVAGIDVHISVEARVLAGYYEAAVYDYEANINVIDRDGYDLGNYDPDIDAETIIADNWCCNAGLTKIQAANIVRKVSETLKALYDEAEAVFQACSEYRLACSGRFSNGEAVYVNIEEPRGQLYGAVAAIA